MSTFKSLLETFKSQPTTQLSHPFNPDSYYEDSTPYSYSYSNYNTVDYEVAEVQSWEGEEEEVTTTYYSDDNLYPSEDLHNVNSLQLIDYLPVSSQIEPFKAVVASESRYNLKSLHFVVEDTLNAPSLIADSFSNKFNTERTSIPSPNTLHRSIGPVASPIFPSSSDYVTEIIQANSSSSPSPSSIEHPPAIKSNSLLNSTNQVLLAPSAVFIPTSIDDNPLVLDFSGGKHININFTTSNSQAASTSDASEVSIVMLSDSPLTPHVDQFDPPPPFITQTPQISEDTFTFPHHYNSLLPITAISGCSTSIIERSVYVETGSIDHSDTIAVPSSVDNTLSAFETFSNPVLTSIEPIYAAPLPQLELEI